MKSCCPVNFILILFLFTVSNFITESFAQPVLKDEKINQIWESGLPFITNYTPDDYKASVQNWCFAQDDNGVMYIGNTFGILEFDGINWRLIKLSNKSLVRSLTKDSHGKIYVGGIKEFGFLQPDPAGQMQYHSLLSGLDNSYHNFEDIWYTFAIDTNIYFISYKYIFKWDGKEIKCWTSKVKFINASLVNRQLYIESEDIGIMKMENDKLHLIPGGDKFNDEKNRLIKMLPFSNNEMLVIYYSRGLFLYDYNHIKPFDNSSSGLIKDKLIHNAYRLSNGDYLLISKGYGIYILSSKGFIKQWIDQKRGLISDVVYGAFVDNENAIWLGTNSGISRIEWSLPVRRFNNYDGLSERVEAIAYHFNKLFVGTGNGLFYLDKQFSGTKDNGVIFKRISEDKHRIKELISAGNYLLVITEEKIYTIDKKNTMHNIAWNEGTAVTALKSKLDSSKVYVGCANGQLSSIDLNKWTVTPKLKVEGDIYGISENADGSLWLSTQYNGVYKVDWSRSAVHDYTITAFDTSRGLPRMSFNFVYCSKNKTYATTFDSIFYFDEQSQIFKPDNLFLKQFDKDVNAYGFILTDELGNIWQTVRAGIENRIYHTRNGRLEEFKYSRRFPDFMTYQIDSFKGLIFLRGPKGIIVYNKNLDDKTYTPPAVLLRKIIDSDSLIFVGNLNENKKTKTELPFQKGSLRFTYALPGFDKSGSNQYQYFLEGYNQYWSSWSNETQRDFTNLYEGDYVFHVRGKNIYGQISPEASFAFTILPPWQRTWWAYLIYIFSGLGIIGLIVQWRSRHLEHEKEELEKIIDERTQQLATQAKQLSKQAVQLKEADKQKARFFANISHEFRTPLTLIRGPVEQALKKQDESISKEDKIMMRNNMDRLLRLVNQLLDLSRLDAHSLELNPAEGDIFGFLRAVGSAFISYSEQRGIKYLINIPDGELYTMFDQDKFENIIYNLLSNAFKFTPDKGEISINAFFNNSYLTIEIMDNGKGILHDHLPYIFNRFFQSDNSITREHEGTGIGLSLTKELIVLMQGDIQVESQPGKGSKFTVRIPVKEIALPSDHVPAQNYKTQYNYKDEIKEPIEVNKKADNRDKPVILIVEDNLDMRGFISKELKNDYAILEASNGTEGFEIAKKEIPDLVITDLMMPKMDGMTLCNNLKNDEFTSHIPVVMLTAKAGRENKLNGLESGADDYLTKPFDKKELHVRVNNLIHQRRELRKKFSREIILQPKNIIISNLDEQFLKKVKNLIEENISDENFGVPEMQHGLTMSKTQLHRKMKAVTDNAPGEFLRNYRLQRAAQLISGKSNSVSQIAYAVGFNNLSYFTKCFKQLFGVIPSEYDPVNDIN